MTKPAPRHLLSLYLLITAPLVAQTWSTGEPVATPWTTPSLTVGEGKQFAIAGEGASRTFPGTDAIGALASTTLNFDSVGTSATPYFVDATTYLDSHGISVSTITPGTHLNIVNDLGYYNGLAIRAPSAPNTLTQMGSNAPVTFTLSFSPQLESFSFKRSSLIAATSSGITFPYWRATAFNAVGTQIGPSVGENNFGSFSNVPAAAFSMTGPGIASVRFDSENRGTGFSAIVLDDFVLSYATPAVTLFTATPSVITAGSSSTLSWTTTNASSVTISGVAGTQPANGSISVTPANTATYTLTATGAGTGTASATTTVTVNPASPKVVSFVATPSTVIAGQSSTLSWTTTNATSVTISGLSGTQAANGSTSVTPVNTATYTLTATGAGGTATATATVTVNPASPKVVSFVATPATVIVGQSFTLSWTTTNATSVTISGVAGPQPANGSLSVTPASTTTYTLTATGAGGTATATTSVNVTSAPLGRHRTVRPPPSPVIESASALVRSSTGGKITLPSGGTVSIASGLLQSDENVLVSLLREPPRQPGGNIAVVGTPVCIAFSPVKQGSSLAPPPDTTATGINVVLDLSHTAIEAATGAVPFSELIVPTLPLDSRDVFLGVPGGVDAVKRTATVNFSKGLLDSFEVSRSGSTATVCAELANWSGRTSATSLAVTTLADLPALLRFDGATWAPIGPGELHDPGRTCVMVHGVLSSVEDAFSVECMRHIQEQNGCNTVLGFNYAWYQSIDQSANELVNALARRGLHNVVIEGHSLGGVVAMTAIPRLSLGGLTIDHFVTLGSPMSGTPVASNVQNLITLLAYKFDRNLAGASPLPPLTTFINSIGIKDQLIPGSSFLTSARAAFLSSTPKIPWTAAAGDQGEFGKTLSAFMCDFIPCDGLSPVPSSLASDWPTAVVHPLPVFSTVHTGLECDDRVFNAVGNEVNPFTPLAGIVGVVPDKMSFSMSVGGFAPTPQAFTIMNSSQQKDSRLTYSVAKTQAWLALDGPLITLGPGEMTIFNALIAGTAALKAGIYSDVITVTDTTSSKFVTVPPLISSPPKTIAVSLTITGQASTPTVNSFVASPSTIASGQSSTLTWSTTNTTSVSINGVVEPVSGSALVSPAVTTTYTLTATGTGGTTTATAKVTVNSTSPTVVLFVANPATIVAGQTSTLSWTTTNATSVSISGIAGTLVPNGSVSVSPAATSTYILTAKGPGGTAMATATVTLTTSTTTYYWANWACPSSQCTDVQGRPNGSAGPFCTVGDCNAYGVWSRLPLGYTCAVTATYTKYFTVTPSNGLCFKNGVDFNK